MVRLSSTPYGMISATQRQHQPQSGATPADAASVHHFSTRTGITTTTRHSTAGGSAGDARSQPKAVGSGAIKTPPAPSSRSGGALSVSKLQATSSDPYGWDASILRVCGQVREGDVSL